MVYLIKRFVLSLTILFSMQIASANETIDIVTDPWPPYAYEESGKVVGTDADVTMEVFKKMGLKANIRLLPWKRCLGLVKNKQADAILAVSLTNERKEFLYFPDEPVSTGVTVFFKKAQSPISSIDLSNAAHHQAGAVLGYKYCDELDNSPLIKQASRVSTLKQNLNKLLLGRIDLVVDVESVGFYTALEMGISDQLAVVGEQRYCAGGNYLAFVKKPEYENLAKAFGETLVEFKATDEYRQILAKYGKSL